MGWISHRKQDENARELREQLAAMHEGELGRPLTAKELKAVAEDAARTAEMIAKRARGEEW